MTSERPTITDEEITQSMQPLSAIKRVAHADHESIDSGFALRRKGPLWM
jgi:hypothetical protein